MTEEQVRQAFTDVEETALGFNEDTVNDFVQDVHVDIAGLYALYHQLKKHHWVVEGDNFRDLHEYLGEVAYDVEEHVDIVAERVQALGAVPLNTMHEYNKHTPFSVEGVDAYPIRTSLENDLEAFKVMISRVRDRIGDAIDNNDYVSEDVFRGVLDMLEEHAHHLEHYLEDDTLYES